MNGYTHGLDVLGEGIADFIPWLGVVTNVVSQVDKAYPAVKPVQPKEPAKPTPAKPTTGAIPKTPTAATSTTATPASVATSPDMYRFMQMQVQQKAEAEAAKKRTILYVVLGAVGVVGVGSAALLLRRRT